MWVDAVHPAVHTENEISDGEGLLSQRMFSGPDAWARYTELPMDCVAHSLNVSR